MGIFDSTTGTDAGAMDYGFIDYAPADTPYPVPSGIDTSGASASIFDTLAKGIGSLGASVASFKNAITQNNITNLQNQASIDIAKANAQAAVIRAQAAATPAAQSSLMLIIAIVGVGLAFLSYAKH